MQLLGSHHSHASSLGLYDSGRIGLARSSSQASLCLHTQYHNFSPLSVFLIQVVNHSVSYSATPALCDGHPTSYYQSPSPSFGEDDNLGSTTMTNNKTPHTQGFWRSHQDPCIWSVMEPALHSFHFLMLTGDIFRNHMVMCKYISTAFETAFKSTGINPFEITSPMVTMVSTSMISQINGILIHK
jgi:hypothetical protein